MLLPKPPSKVLKGGSGAGLAGGSGSIRGGIGRAGADGRGGGSGAAAGAANSFLPPQLRGRSNVATEDLDRIFSKRGKNTS
ncbi:unnamed protein product [Closterium sp. NIES-54]